MHSFDTKEVEPKVLRASYGVDLPQAAILAMLEYKSDLALVARMGLPLRPYVFDYFGLTLPVSDETSADELVKQIRALHKVRAEQYAKPSLLAKTTERAQGGRPGDCITDATPRAIQCAQLWGNSYFKRSPEQFASMRHVFEWNSVKVPFNPWAENEAERLAQAVMAAQAAAAEAYRNSAEHKAYEAKQDAERHVLQEKVAKLMKALPTTLKKPMPAIVNWAVAFSEGHDRRGVTTDGAAVVAAFQAAGFEPGAYVGTQYREQMRQDKDMFGRYVLGQFLAILPLQQGMPPVLWDFAERFKAMA